MSSIVKTIITLPFNKTYINNHAAAAIISSVKKSNLNFYIQESPFSIFINLRKTFIKNRSGNILEQVIQKMLHMIRK